MALVLQDGYSPLFTASIKGHSEVVKILIEAGANVNQGDKVRTVHPSAESLCYTKYSVCACEIYKLLSMQTTETLAYKTCPFQL